jgi:glycerophosphoryl diester phosphodiesterase
VIRLLSFRFAHRRVNHRKLNELYFKIKDYDVLQSFFDTNPNVPQLQAHRGLWGPGARENSIEAFQAAWDAGIRACELDVQVSQDGVLVVCHDDHLQKLFGVEARISDELATTLWEQWKIPSLAQVLKSVNPEMFWNIEIKCTSSPFEVIRVMPAVSAFLSIRSLDRSRVLFSSFNPLALLWLKCSKPQYTRALLVPDVQPFQLNLWARLVQPEWIHCPEAELTEEKIKSLKQRQFKIAAWTVRSRIRRDTLLEWGADSVICDPF